MANWISRVELKDVFHDDTIPFEQKRDIIVKRLRKVFTDEEWEIEDLASTEDVDDFDEVWDSVYDLADARRVWISTF